MRDPGQFGKERQKMPQMGVKKYTLLGSVTNLTRKHGNFIFLNVILVYFLDTTAVAFFDNTVNIYCHLKGSSTMCIYQSHKL